MDTENKQKSSRYENSCRNPRQQTEEEQMTPEGNTLPENLWIEVGVLCKTMKEKRSIVETLKQHFNIDVKSVGGTSKRRWLEATVFMENLQPEEAVNKVSKLLEGTGADGWLDVWTHAFSRHVTSAKSEETQQKAAVRSDED